MAHRKNSADRALDTLLALLTEPQQQVILAYIGKHGLQRDDDIFAMMSLLKVNALLVMKVAQSVEEQREFEGDLQEMMASSLDAFARLFDGERHALLSKWGDIIGFGEEIRAILANHQQKMAEQIRALRNLATKLAGQTEALTPLFDLLKAGPDDANALTPTHFVLDAIQHAVASAITQVQDAGRDRRWWHIVKIGYDVAIGIGIVVLLYRR